MYPLFTTAYLPPIEYFSCLIDSSSIFLEKEENYIKQSFRNRCYILSANGPQILTVPVLMGSFHKTPIKDIRIDYSKRWQQVHIRSMVSAYNNSPFFEFYFEEIEKAILTKNRYLFDLNTDLFRIILKFLGMEKKIFFTECFIAPNDKENDYRYSISPKIKNTCNDVEYIQVFHSKKPINGLSIIDLLFNCGHESLSYLKKLRPGP